MKLLLSFAIFSLIWSTYYLAMRTTADVLTIMDMVVCGIFVVFDIGIIIFFLQKNTNRGRRESEFPFIE